MQSVTPKSLSRRLIGASLSTLPAAVMTTLVMTFTAGWSPGVHAAQDAIVCPADRINSNGNICTASDVQLAAAAVGAGSEGGVCTPGEQIPVAIAGTVALRKGDRFDIGIWVSTDGKPIELRGGNDLLDPGNVPDEGGAQTCEVLPLPYMPISLAGAASPVIDSFDSAAPIQDCYDTSANNNGDLSEGFLLTEPRDNVVNGRVDVNADGVINSDDTVVDPAYPVVGAYVQTGVLDLDRDGIAGEVNGDDSGVWSGRAVQNGLIDYNNDGQFGQPSDTAVQEFNDLLTVTCQAGPSAAGGLLLDSLVTWNVPSDAANVCNPLDPSTYSDSFTSSKCSVSSSEIDIQIVGKLTVIKQAPANPGLDFNFAYTNDMPTTVDTDVNPGNDISATSPFTLKDGESAVIYGVIGTRTVDGGPFVPANIVVSETSLPAGWEIDDIVCTGPEGAPLTTPAIINTVAGTATIELSYDAVDFNNSQDDVTCTFINAEAPATLTVVKNTNGGDDVFDFTWASTNNPGPNDFTLDTSTGPGTASTDIIITNGLGDTNYAIGETLTAQQLSDGWSIESAQCVDSNNGDTPVGLSQVLGGTAGVTGMTINPGDHITCTFVNNAAAQLTVTKIAQGGNDTFSYTSNLGAPWAAFDLTTVGGAANTGAIPVPVPDSATGTDVSIDEIIPSGWSLAGISCTNVTETVLDNNVQFNLQPGATVNCTFTNLADGNISIVKNTIGGDGNFQFTTDVPGATSPFNIQTTDNVGSVSIATPPPGTYTVSEVVPSKWDLTDISCNDNNSGQIDADTAQIIVEAGESITCTFTNTQRGQLVIRKFTDPDSNDVFGFTSTSSTATPIPASFDVTPGTDVVFTNGGANLLAGTYTVTENDPTPGYDLTNIICTETAAVGPNPPTWDVATRTATMNLDPGEVVICEFYNAKRANLTIEKVVTTDGPAVNDFDFSSNTLPDATFQLLDVTAAVPVSTTYNNLVPGSYDVAEDVDAALANGWALVDASCTDGSTVDNIVLDPGDDVTCTFTNAPLGSATIVKNTVGGNDTFDFVGTAPFDGLQLTTVGGTASQDYAFQLDPANNPYGIQEDPLPAGWSLTGLLCVEDGDQDSTTDLVNRAATIYAQFNEQITCTFTNTLNGTIIIRKETLPDGAPDVFTFEGDVAGSIADGEDITVSVQPGVYTSSELVPAGWALTDISCSAGAGSSYVIGDAGEFVDGDTGVAITLAAGETVDCTFTNTAQGSITIAKQTVGGDGVFNFGSAALGNFAIDTGVDPDRDFQNLLPDLYMVAENPIPDGWALTNIVCEGDTLSQITIGADDVFTPGDTGVSINLAPGENILCTFTNTELGSITLAKLTLPTGSLDSFDFTGDVIASLTDGQSVTVSDLMPGAYSSTETVPAGWDLVDIQCDDGASTTPSTGDLNTATVTFNVEAGEDVTCAFTNVQQATVIVQKIVVRDNGGNATVGQFGITSSVGTLNFDGGPTVGFVSTYTATVTGVVPGTGYSVSETPISGYTPSNWSCTDDSGSILENGGDPTGALFTVGPGKTVTCAITNDDVAPTLTLIKNVVNDNGGNAGPDDFGISVGGTPVTSGASNPYDANTPLAIDETGLAGYSFVSITGDAQCPEALGGTIVLAEGENVTCTITNDDQAPGLILIKDVINNNGGNAGPNDFGISVDGNLVVSGASTPVAANTPVVINEAGLTGYSFVSITGDAKCPASLGGTVTLDPGETVTCTITNDDIAPTLTLIKSVINDDFGTAGPDDFGISVGGTPVASGASNPYDANTALAIDEAGLSGYSFVSITGDAKCPASLGGTVTLDEGENVTCTITNDDDPPNINLAKSANGPATLEADGTYTVVYTVTATNNGDGPGEYNLTDTFSPANGVTFNSAVLAYVAGSEDSQTGALTTPPLVSGGTWVTGEALGAGLNESWTITANFTVDAAVIADGERVCNPDNAQNTGFYNYVEGVVNEVDLSDNDACVDVPDPAINLAKTANGPATLNPDHSYTVVYTVTATNTGEGPGVYDLTDTFSPANGVTFNSAELAYVAGSEDSQTGTLATPPLASGGTWVTGEALAAGQNESWTITANFTVDPAVIADGERVCNPDNAQNTGFYNYVEGVVNEVDLSDNDACVDVPDPLLNLAKSVNGPAVLEQDGTYTVVYTVAVTNAGEGPGAYDLTDTFSPATGVTFNSAELAYVAGSEDSQTGTLATPPLANGGTWVTGEALAAGQNESWTITANFSVDPALLPDDERQCDPENAVNTGFYNYVEGVVNEEDLSDNDACTEVPVPAINLAKTADPAVQVGADLWEVTYTVTATNTGNGAGIYDVIDELSPGIGITLVADASYPSIAYAGGETQSGTITPPPLANGGTWVSDEALNPGASESWVIVARFQVDTGLLTESSADCVLDVSEDGTGYYNLVTGSPTDVDLSDNEACVPAMLPSVPVPVNNPLMLLFMLMAMIAMAWYFRPAAYRRD